MGLFTVIPQDTFNGLQVDAGVLLKTFDPAHPAAPDDEDIISATTGGINASCVPSYIDWGEDVDNCPNNMKELKKLDGWDCKMSTTCIGTTTDQIKLSLGAADFSAPTYAASTDTAVVSGKTYYTRSGTSGNYTYTKVVNPTGNPSTSSYYEISAPGVVVTPRRDLEQTDFSDIWWVGDRSDGGLVAIRLINALSTGGFTLQTTKKGKGQFSLELTGHVSINSQDVVPMVFYSMEPTA